MRTVPGSEIVGSAELRRRAHKKRKKKKKKSKTRGGNWGEKGRRSLYSLPTFRMPYTFASVSPIISKPGTGYLTIG